LAPALAAFDFDKGELTRNENGFCIRCGINEPGEAIGKVQNDPASAGSRFEGYTSAAETEKRILRHVFAAGDAWVRTGDLMRQDEKGFFYFVDRIGDTFRWKGENVATSEVAQVLCAFEGILHASVYGVAIPGTEGRARDGGHRLRRRPRSRRAAPASRRAVACLRLSAFSSALSAGRVNRHLQICEDRSRPAGIQP
jgi:acyl-CoA synthetase (AMP-forming)/AMP-acid ligase II